jgi:hypothetical protein
MAASNVLAHLHLTRAPNAVNADVYTTAAYRERMERIASEPQRRR